MSDPRILATRQQQHMKTSEKHHLEAARECVYLGLLRQDGSVMDLTPEGTNALDHARENRQAMMAAMLPTWTVECWSMNGVPLLDRDLEAASSALLALGWRHETRGQWRIRSTFAEAEALVTRLRKTCPSIDFRFGVAKAEPESIQVTTADDVQGEDLWPDEVRECMIECWAHDDVDPARVQVARDQLLEQGWKEQKWHNARLSWWTASLAPRIASLKSVGLQACHPGVYFVLTFPTKRNEVQKPFGRPPESSAPPVRSENLEMVCVKHRAPIALADGASAILAMGKRVGEIRVPLIREERSKQECARLVEEAIHTSRTTGRRYHLDYALDLRECFEAFTKEAPTRGDLGLEFRGKDWWVILLPTDAFVAERIEDVDVSAGFKTKSKGWRNVVRLKSWDSEVVDECDSLLQALESAARRNGLL